MHVCVLWVADWLEGGSCICTCVCCGQLIGEKVAHAYTCVCVVAADWWQGGSCICMCVCCGS